MVCLTVAACVDLREHRIPNVVPLTMTVFAVISLTIGFLTDQQGYLSYIFSSVVSSVVVAILMLVASILTKKGIGMGDIKLLSALALLGGVYTICGTLFFGITLCAVAALVLLALKKKTVKEGLPFAPFVLLGYFITIAMSIY